MVNTKILIIAALKVPCGVLGSFRTYLVSDFSVWFTPKLQVWDLPRITVQIKQLNLGPTKRGGLSPDQTEPWFGLFLVWKHFLDGSDFRNVYRKFWQAIVRTGKRKNSATKWGTAGTPGEEETKCWVLIIIIANYYNKMNLFILFSPLIQTVIEGYHFVCLFVWETLNVNITSQENSTGPL